MHRNSYSPLSESDTPLLIKAFQDKVESLREGDFAFLEPVVTTDEDAKAVLGSFDIDFNNSVVLHRGSLMANVYQIDQASEDLYYVRAQYNQEDPVIRYVIRLNKNSASKIECVVPQSILAAYFLLGMIPNRE